jgi:single-stranded DNA-binding protein
VFFPITVFGKQAEVVAQYVTKGRQVLVEGRIEASDNGRMSVVADRVVFGASPNKSRADDPGMRTSNRPPQTWRSNILLLQYHKGT